MSAQVAELIDRIKTLVAENRRPRRSRGRREALAREIATLQVRLADVVRRELSAT